MVVRISRGSFDRSKGAKYEALLKESEQVLVPAIRRLKGLQHYYAGIDHLSATLINVSVWDTVEEAQQMESLPEMIAQGKKFTAAGVQFERPINNYQTLWNLG